MYMGIYIYVYCVLCMYIKIGYDCVKIDSNGIRGSVHNTQCGIKRNEMKSN